MCSKEETVCVSLRGFSPVTQARTESWEAESGPTPSFMKPAHRTESPSPQMTSSPSPSPSFCCTSFSFYSASLAPLPLHLLFSCLSFFLRSFLLVCLLCCPSFSLSLSHTPLRLPCWGGVYCGIPCSPDSQPVGSDYLDNPHPFLFYEFALD